MSFWVIWGADARQTFFERESLSFALHQRLFKRLWCTFPPLSLMFSQSFAFFFVENLMFLAKFACFAYFLWKIKCFLLQNLPLFLLLWKFYFFLENSAVLLVFIVKNLILFLVKFNGAFFQNLSVCLYFMNNLIIVAKFGCFFSFYRKFNVFVAIFRCFVCNLFKI